MLYINKTTCNETIDFAAHELKKYLRMMMPNGGDITITYTKNTEEGYNLGLMQDFGLDVSDAKDTALDDILYIDTTENGGIIAGDNPRSVLMAVYEFLRQNGCRWLFPGVDGEYIPMKKPEAVKYRHMPSMRYRGPCIEGATSQQVLLETLDFLPKVGMNIFQMQFLVPTVFYSRYYNHDYNEYRNPEPLSSETMLQWKTACEAEMSKRGTIFYDVGHGWTVAPFGVDISSGWDPIPDEEVPEEGRKYLALLNGKRELYKGVPLNTQFCMSSPEARTKMANYIADYAERHTNVDFLDVWLGDGHNNHCQCEECSKKSVTDWYMMLLNEIDEALTARNLKTRIVFCQYTETTWAPETEMIKNTDRFTMMLAPISRSYSRTLTDKKVDSLPPFNRNNIQLPADLDEYLAHYDEWKKVWKGTSFCFEYHFWKHHCFDPSGMLIAKRVFEDIEAYRAKDIDGMVACGSQRAYFPTGFGYYVFARKQFDASLTFDELMEDYFSTAFGEDWRQFADYLYEIADCFGGKYMEGEESTDLKISKYISPPRAEKMRRIGAVTEKGMELIKSHYNSDKRIQTVSVRLLEHHALYCKLLGEAMAYKCEWKHKEAIAAFEVFQAEICKREPLIERYYELHTSMRYFERIIKLHAYDSITE